MIKYDGYVYILKIQADHTRVYKVGTTNRNPQVRMLEIAGELFRVLGYIPRIQLLRQRQTKNNYRIEETVLRETKSHRCTLGLCQWPGESELRNMEEQMLLSVYDKAVAQDYPPIKTFKVSL